MPLVYDDDESGSWGRQSEGWPETKDCARDKVVFLSKLTTPPVPYGSYVIMGIRCGLKLQNFSLS